MEQLELPFDYTNKEAEMRNVIKGLLESTIKIGAFCREAFPVEKVKENKQHQYSLNLTGVLNDKDFKDLDEMFIYEHEISEEDRKELLMNGFQYQRNLWIEEPDSSRGTRG